MLYFTSKWRWPRGKKYLNWMYRQEIISKHAICGDRTVNAEKYRDVYLYHFVGIKFFDNLKAHMMIL